MKKINILQITLGLDIGGSEKMIVNLLSKLDREKFNPFVCCIGKEGVLKKDIESLGIPVFTLNKGEKFDVSTISKIKKIIKEHKIDVIHTHHLGALIYGLPASKLAGIKKIIHTEHSCLYYKTNKKLSFLAKILLNHASMTSCVCEEVCVFIKKILKVNPTKVTTLLNGIDIDKFCKSSKEGDSQNNKFIIGSMGRLAPVKNHATLLNAFKKASDRLDDMTLMIVGDGPLMGELKKEIAHLGIGSKVEMSGYREDTAELLSAMDIFVLPSLSEGLSLTLLEAMASNLPIIASNVGGNKDLISEGVSGLLFEPMDVDVLADKIIYLYENKEKGIGMGTNARALIEQKYSLNEMVNKYQELYTE